MNSRMRMFQDELNELVNKFGDVPIEARLMALEITTLKVQSLADSAILKELEGEVNKNAESIQPN